MRKIDKWPKGLENCQQMNRKRVSVCAHGIRNKRAFLVQEKDNDRRPGRSWRQMAWKFVGS